MDCDELLAVLAEGLQANANDIADQPFAEVVGDSLRALKLMDFVFEQVGVHLDLGVLYRCATVRAATQALAHDIIQISQGR